MNQLGPSHDSHTAWLQDIEYRKEYGAEGAKLEIAAELVKAREMMRMTQSDLAELAGTSQAYISRLEKGDANPTIGKIGSLLACMWLKPSIWPKPMEPYSSMESVVIRNLSGTEARVDYPEIYVSHVPYSIQVNA